MNWLLLLPQLPASPSTLRVTVWRRMRAAGALSLQNGVWVLPSTPEYRRFAEGQVAYIKQQNAASYLFEVISRDPAVEETLLTSFRAERDEEYAEFGERCEALLAEIEKETAGAKFTFAELEETEADLHKLEAWLGKITTRDFAGGEKRPAALDAWERCRQAYKIFAARVYAQQGIDSPDRPHEQRRIR
jgi:hypothetical protein